MHVVINSTITGFHPNNGKIYTSQFLLHLYEVLKKPITENICEKKLLWFIKKPFILWKIYCLQKVMHVMKCY